MISNIEEALERSIFHILRKKTVEYGYVPDVDNYDFTNPDKEVVRQANLAYKEALADIIADKGFAIELFNYANSQSYGTKKVPRIVVRTEAFLQGQLGTDTTVQYRLDEEGKYKKYQSTSLLSDFYFHVYLIANTTEQIRVLHQIMVTSIPRRGYIPWYDKDFLKHSNLLVRYISSADYEWNAEGIIEKAYRYEIPDAHEVEDYLINNEQVAPIEEIVVTMNNDDNKLIID